MCLVHDGEEASVATNKVVGRGAADIQALNARRNIVVGDVKRWKLVFVLVEDILSQASRQVTHYVGGVVWTTETRRIASSPSMPGGRYK